LAYLAKLLLGILRLLGGGRGGEEEGERAGRKASDVLCKPMINQGFSL
jgi:hypothetical protein